MSEAGASLIVPPVCPQGDACALQTQLTRLRSELETLRALVHTDELTGLFNYRHFAQGLELEMERSRRSGKPVALLMIDLDHFKRFNDTWGHEAGNMALRHVARLIQNTVRRLDIPCRYGGEEFAIILPDTSLHAACVLAERLRAVVAQTPVHWESNVIELSCSIGVDVHTAADRDDARGFVRRADAWLLQAKTQGRNRVCHPAERPPTHVESDERDMLLHGE
jgi:diguanylate cyclase (GGDEF)-like protein